MYGCVIAGYLCSKAVSVLGLFSVCIEQYLDGACAWVGWCLWAHEVSGFLVSMGYMGCTVWSAWGGMGCVVGVFGVFKGCIVYGMGCMVRCVHVCMGCTMGTVTHALCLPSSSLLPRNDNVGVGVCNINPFLILTQLCVLIHYTDSVLRVFVCFCCAVRFVKT